MSGIKRILIALLLTGCVALCSCTAQTDNKTSNPENSSQSAEISKSQKNDVTSATLEQITESKNESEGVSFGTGETAEKSESGKITSADSKNSDKEDKKNKSDSKDNKETTTEKKDDGVVEMPIIPID